MTATFSPQSIANAFRITIPSIRAMALLEADVAAHMAKAVAEERKARQMHSTYDRAPRIPDQFMAEMIIAACSDWAHVNEISDVLGRSVGHTRVLCECMVATGDLVRDRGFNNRVLYKVSK